MSTPEFSVPEAGAGITSEMASKRASTIVLHNSKILCGITLLGSLFAALIGAGMLVVALTQLFPDNGFHLSALWSALTWVVAGLSMLYLCARFWQLGRNMAGYQVQLDPLGVSFKLGTRKKPSDLVMPWDEISAVKRRRIGNAQQFWVQGKTGSEARFSSYTFFRPKKVARMIAERAGLTIQKI